MQHDSVTIAYWDKVFKASVPEDRSYLVLNYWKRPRLMRFLLDYDFFDKTVLEIGCGIAMTAGILNLLHGGRWKYKGIDLSEYACLVTRELFNINVEQCSAEALPAKDKSLDYIFAFDVLEHIFPQNLIIVAKEFDRCLKEENARVLINNPLSQGVHDPKYDFDLRMEAIAQFARKAGLGIERVENWTAHEKRYQFIVMVR